MTPWRSVKIAEKLTYSQWLEKAEALRQQHGDSTEHVLDIPEEEETESKYNLRQLKSRGDYHVEGELMENCINLDSSYNRAGDLHSLRDENNFPVVSMRMRRRTNDDWWSTDSNNATTINYDSGQNERNPDVHHTGNDVLVVDEAVQRGNAPITKYIRPALNSIVQYAKQNNIPKVVFKNGPTIATTYQKPVDVGDIEKLLNSKDETPDFLYVSALKGLRKENGSLPAKPNLLSNENIEPVIVHEHPLADNLVKGENNEEINTSDFYETMRVPFSKKRFEKQYGLPEQVQQLFSSDENNNQIEGWRIRPHVEELPKSILNDVVKTSNQELKPFSGVVHFNNSLGTAGYGNSHNLSGYLTHSETDTGFIQVKPDLIHPNMVKVPVSTYGVYAEPGGTRQWGYRTKVNDVPVLLSDTITKHDMQHSPQAKKIYIATPSSLRDNPVLFDREGINSAFTYTTFANLSPARSGFTGTTKNDIWEIDPSKLPLDSLSRLRHSYGGRGEQGRMSAELTGVIPYEALSLSSQSEMNKRKPLPSIIKQCKTCDTPWGEDDDAHEGHEAKLVNSGVNTSKPEKFGLNLPRYINSEALDALNRGEIHESIKNDLNTSLREPVRPYVSPEEWGGRPHITVDYNEDDFEDSTGYRWYRPDRYSDYASGFRMPTGRTYRLKNPEQPHDLNVNVVGNLADVPAKPEKMYFGIDSQSRRDERVYTGEGIVTSRYYNRSPFAPTAERIEPTHDTWSIDTNHPEIKDKVLWDTQNRTWTFNHDGTIPYGSLHLERRAEEAVSPHIRQFFSSVAAYLNSRRVAQYLTDGESSGGWVSEYWGQGGSVSAPTTADPNEVAIDPQTGKRKRPNGSLWTTIGDNGIDNPMFVRQLMNDPKFENIVKGWQGLKNLFTPNTPGINSYSSVIRIVEAASRRQERLQQRQEAIDWVNASSEPHQSYYTPAAETVYELPNGFTVKKLKTFGDLGFEGHMMNHCLKEDFLSQCEECEGGGQCVNGCYNGELECNYCDGSGSKTCTSCNGYGQVECSDCYGSGAVEIEDEKVDCSTCNGYGERDCTECDGEMSISCDSCDGLGGISCDECGGTGYCANCGGSGGTVGRNPNQEFDPSNLERAGGQPYSLRNPDDVPVVTWYEDKISWKPGLGLPTEPADYHLSSVYGREDTKPKPEYQQMILQYIKDTKEMPDEHSPVQVEWGRSSTRTYNSTRIDEIISGNKEKPDALYFYHDHFPCEWNSSDNDTPCHERENFTQHIEHQNYDSAWTSVERAIKLERTSPIYRVDTKDLNPQHLIYVPSDESWQINPRKMKDVPRSAFKRVDTKEQFDPKTYGDLGLKNANWKNAAIWDPSKVVPSSTEYPCPNCQVIYEDGEHFTDTDFYNDLCECNDECSAEDSMMLDCPGDGCYDGKITCEACGGDGTVYDAPCHWGCNDGKFTCEDCQGGSKGRLRYHNGCQTCKGTGRVKLKQAALWEPDKILPASEVPCPTCQDIWEDGTNSANEDWYSELCTHKTPEKPNCSIEGIWKNCGNCDGEGRFSCEMCDGEGNRYCYECDEYHECEYCNGGKCLGCDGKGQKFYHNYCKNCEGTGAVPRL